ncbi:hypothetical protein E4U41_002611 [Claviceps citrina]|nr:hypothetical protein E4U41_002611 [Claviceps citrina]
MKGGATCDDDAATATATGGIIFRDMVFWVARRVPMRSHTNGGVVTPLEKDAQVLIADDARKDTPPDSISWKYITESVASGCAQLPDRYCISRPSDSAATAGRTKLTRSEFTKAEDAALANCVLSHSKGRTGNQIYQEFADSHPSHPWQSWRNRFVKVLASRPMHELEKLAMMAPDLAVQSLPGPKRDTRQTTPMTTGQRPLTASTPNQTPPAAAQRPSPRRDPPAIGSPQAGSAKETRRQANVPPASSPAAPSEELGVETQVNMRDRFYHDLSLFVEESGVSVNPDPEVGGKRVELWHLSQAVASQKVPLEEVDWLRVAEDLQYDWRRDREVVEELRRCFEENLAGFFEAISSFITGDGEEEGGGEGEDEQAEVETPSRRRSPKRVFRSSPPAGSPGRRKRRFGAVSPSAVENPAKRTCPSRAAEIPATPEERLGISSTQSPTAHKTRQQSLARGARGRVTSRGETRSAADKDEDDDDMSEQGLPEMHVRRSAPRLETQHSSFDVAPSQQLRSEALNVEPVPLHLGVSRSAGAPPRQSDDAEPRRASAGARPAKTASKAARRSLPVSFRPNSQHSPPAQQAEARAAQQPPSRPARADPDTEEPSPSQSQSQSQSQSLRDWVEHYEGLGYSRAVVMESLNRASLRPGWPASHLMELLSKKEKMPPNMEGVWTDRDDKGLRYADHVRARWATATPRERSKADKELAWLVHKHSQEDVDLRRRFFALQERVG